MTAAELKHLEAARRAAATAAAQATARRNDALVELYDAGVKVRELAELLDLSQQRIRQIVDAHVDGYIPTTVTR